MAKLRNQLYSNPANGKPHDKGAKIILSQAIRVGDKKFIVPAKLYPYNFYINMAGVSESKAIKKLDKILNWVRTHKQDLPLVEKKHHDAFMQFALNTIVWSYAAIEAKVNCIIDELAPLEKKENYLKKTDLGSKLKDIVPKLSKKEKLSNSLWSKFNKLDTIRHKIIHTKTIYWVDAENWNETLVSSMFNGDFKGSTQTGIDIVEHFTIANKNTGPTTLHIVKRGLQSRPLEK